VRHDSELRDVRVKTLCDRSVWSLDGFLVGHSDQHRAFLYTLFEPPIPRNLHQGVIVLPQHIRPSRLMRPPRIELIRIHSPVAKEVTKHEHKSPELATAALEAKDHLRIT
jgi:hypothetical protein